VRDETTGTLVKGIRDTGAIDINGSLAAAAIQIRPSPRAGGRRF
jgi:hypothetical protein